MKCFGHIFRTIGFLEMYFPIILIPCVTNEDEHAARVHTCKRTESPARLHRVCRCIMHIPLLHPSCRRSHVHTYAPETSAQPRRKDMSLSATCAAKYVRLNNKSPDSYSCQRVVSTVVDKDAILKRNQDSIL